MEPMDRSMPLVMMAMVIPMEMINRNGSCCMTTVVKLSSVQKFSVVRENPMIITSSISTWEYLKIVVSTFCLMIYKPSLLPVFFSGTR